MDHGVSSVLIMASVRWYNASAHYALRLACSLKKSGIDITLFGIPGSPVIEHARKLGIQVIDSIDLMNKNPIAYINNLRKFKKLLRGRAFDIINPHISRDHTFAFLSGFLNSSPIVRTRTDSIPPKKNIFNKLFYKFSANRYSVSSRFMVSHLVNMGVAEKSVSVIPPDIDYKKFSDYIPLKNQKAELAIPDDRVTVSFIGRLDAVKGVEYFIRSFPLLKNKNKIHFIVSGEEINLSKQSLSNLAKQLNIDSISIIDRQDDVRDILHITDIGVIPSTGSEAICRIALEMISFGIPVIGSNINSIPDTISRFYGIVVSPGDPEKIAEAIDLLVSNDTYTKISRDIKSKLSKEPPDRFSAEYLDIFSKAAD